MFKGIQASCLRALPLAGLVAVTSFSLVSITAAAQSGASAFTTIDVPGAGTGAFQGTAVTAIDTAGDAVGIYIDASNAIHGFVLPAGGTITTFDVTGAGTSASQGTIPICVNSSGVIAGTYIDTNSANHGFVRAADGTITAFDAPGAPTTTSQRGTSAASINDSGVIVGFYSTGTYLTNSVYHGFQRAANGVITNVDDPNAGSGDGPGFKQGTYAYGINDSGEIVGSYTDLNFEHHGFLLSGGTYTVIDPLGVGTGTCINNHGKNYGGTTARSIDAAGNVAGSYLDVNCSQHGFVRSSSGTITSFDGPGADPSPCPSMASVGETFCGTAGLAFDSAGDITGGYEDSDGIAHGLVRPAATGIITSFSDPSAATTGTIAGTLGLSIYSDASGIHIAGVYDDANSMLHGFIYTPALTATTTILSPVPTPNPSIYGEPVTLAATVSSSGGTPANGENVTFMSGATALGTAQLSSGTASITTTTLPTGADSIIAVYGGDSNFAGSTSAALIQTVGKASSTTTLSSSPNPSSFQELVTFTAGVSGQFGGLAAGSVTFSMGSTSLGTVPMSGGSAAFTFTALPQGSDSITAVYNGDSNFSASTSNSVSQVVNAEVLGDWTWMGGSGMVGSNGGQAGVYGILDRPAAANIPGSRQIPATWTDNSGNLWLFGGWGYDSTGLVAEQLNDLWEFNPSANVWAWMGGSSTIGSNGGQPGMYGMLGTPAAANIPGSRNSASTWTDSSGNLWLFGGSGYDVNSNFSVLNDLWEFNPAINQWEWVSGSEYVGQSGVYGSLGTPSSAAVPGARYGASSWIDGSGNLWLFGGLGKDSTGATNWLNDVWEFSPSTKQWTWMGGSSTIGSNCGASGCGQPGTYGTLGKAAAANIPGSRKFATSWTDSQDNFWLFGGYGNDANDTEGWLNDLWKLNPYTDQWAWMGGSSTVGSTGGHAGVYTNPGSNLPGGRQSGASWTDGSGNLWLFGGEGLDVNGAYGFINDLWEYNPSTNLWAWIGGSSTVDQSGAYNTLAVPATANIPGGRGYAGAWFDNGGNFWIFGGNGYDASGSHGDLDDLWKYQPTAVTSPNATLSAASLLFGSENVGSTSASQSVTLTNKSSVSLAITSITVTGTDASSFVFANTCGSSLAAGISCTIHGQFKPAAAGALTAKVTISDNAVGSPQSISLSGTGTASGTPAMMISPTPGSTLGISNVQFTWTTGTEATQYNLWLGLSGLGSSSLYTSGWVTSTSVTVPSLPDKAATVYARLYSLVNGVVQYNDYTYTEAPAPAGSPAAMITPAQGSALGASNVMFTWTAGTGATEYDLWLGVSGPGSSSLYTSGWLTTMSTAVTSLPAKGATVYARLYSMVNGAVQYNDYTYAEQ